MIKKCRMLTFSVDSSNEFGDIYLREIGMKFTRIVDGKTLQESYSSLSSRFRQNMISDQLPFDEKVLIFRKRGCGQVTYL